jgi:glycine/D-amino acid oxidase-like deaminating enzyme
MIDRADVVVIGAGAFGLSVAYHLAALGAGRVALLDRFQPGSQTSPRAAGLFKLVQADETRTRLKQLSIHKVTHFAEETGVPLPVVQSGSLLLARTPEHAALIEREARQSLGWNVELEMIDGAEARRLMPALESDDFLAACHIPGDVYIEEPRFLLQAYLAAIASQPVDVLPATTVTGIRLANGAVTGVETTSGEIEAPVVVDAAGAWARAVAAGAGEVPVVPTRHQLLITQPVGGIEERHPIARIIDAAVYVRPARGGLMFGGFEADPLVVDPRERGDAFTIDDVPLDLRVLDRLSGLVRATVPAVHDAPVAEHRGGLFTMTADGRFLAGPVPGVRGLWAATGCNGSGFSFSPAIGQVLAEWITTGAPSIDITSLSPERFAGAALDEAALRDAAIWQYANYYTPHVAPDGA